MLSPRTGAFLDAILSRWEKWDRKGACAVGAGKTLKKWREGEWTVFLWRPEASFLLDVIPCQVVEKET